jgi:acylphosphatase
MLDGILRLRARVFGTVQGVGFRYFIYEKAHALDLTGWVMNIPVGSVEVVAEGDVTVMNELLSALQKCPRSAIVDNVRSTLENATGEFRQFGARF